ncbi:MAG: hypothetical protein HFI26_06205 [Lachnospiraceae bacterium]|jgi:hypothetical protein|nr:hypothetical protein [Lachnospiraceae bacterium]
MAVTGIREDEYDNLLVNMQAIHENIIQMIQDVTKQITELNRSEGGFSVNQVSDKIDLLVGELTNMSSSMQTAFDAGETIVRSFRDAIDNYDTCC